MRVCRSNWLASLGAALVLAVPAVAVAGDAATAVYKLQDGIGGPSDPIEEENGKDYAGAGSEQSTVTWFQKGTDVYVLAIWMSSDVSEADRPWQLKCSSLKLSQVGEPTLMVDAMQITTLGDPINADERPANHPHLAKIDENLAILSYGSDDDNGNTQTYVQLVNEMCEIKSEMLRISNDANNNQGAPECAVHGGMYITCGYYDNNDQRTYARGLIYDPAVPSLTNDWLSVVVTPSDIGRPAIVSASADRAFLCAAKGVDRPPEMGVECAMINAMSGEVLFKDYIHMSDPGNAMYFNQPSVAKVGDYIAVQTVMSSGDGKLTNDKGESTTYIDVVQPNDIGLQLKSTLPAVGPYQAHPGLCAGGFGAVGGGQTAEPHMALFQAPITGAGQPALLYVDYDEVSKNIMVDMNYKFWFVGWYADSGYLANIYGQNPNDQGRDFLRCVSDVPNPAYQMDGGFKPTVKTFTVAPHSGRMYGDEPKNALWLGLVPAQTEQQVTPEPPEPPTKPPVSTENPPQDPSDPSGRNDPVLGDAASGCACGVVGSDTSGYGALFALALGAFAFARRRREEV